MSKQPRKPKPKSKQALRRKRVPIKKESVVWKFTFEKKNFIIVGIGLGVIIIGFLLMATGISDEAAVPDGTWNNPLAVDVAPILLLIGYCVIIPYAILKVFRKDENAGKDAAK